MLPDAKEVEELEEGGVGGGEGSRAGEGGGESGVGVEVVLPLSPGSGVSSSLVSKVSEQ